jgi:hypothetical protein
MTNAKGFNEMSAAATPLVNTRHFRFKLGFGVPSSFLLSVPVDVIVGGR